METAWNFLKKLKRKTEMSLGEKEILEVGLLVDPRNKDYRTRRVTLNFRDYTPPSPERVAHRIRDFLTELKDPNFHPIERAAYAHSRPAAIQPFMDGNKRTARLVQNRILCDNGYPYATIPLGEREYYLELLRQSMVAYKMKDMKRMAPFFNYVAAKVNVSLDEILASESKRRK